MKLTTRTAAPVLLVAALATMSLGGCAPESDPDRDPVDEGSSGEQQPCIVGTWKLDVADYGNQSEAYVLGLGLPIVDFAMDGDGTIQFTADGLVSTGIDLTTTGTIVAGDTQVPLNSRSGYTATGDWSPGDDLDSIDLANWSNVPDPSIPVDPAAPPVPAIDYTDVDAVMAFCTEEFLVLQAPGTPLSARWTR
jgi:hypothetical protein